jgi:hypothetical protein
MARTLSWTGAVSNHATNAANWYDETDMMTATAPPGPGDTAIIAFGTVDEPTDAMLSGNLFAIGGTGGAATIVFNGDAATEVATPTVDAASTIDTQVPGQTTAEQTVLDANGTFVNHGSIEAEMPHAA